MAQSAAAKRQEMTQAVPQRRRTGSASDTQAQARFPWRGFKVFSGAGAAAPLPTTTQSAMVLVRMIAICLAVVFAACIIRVGFYSASVNTMIEGNKLTSAIETQRDLGNSYEVSQARSTVPGTLRVNAAKLGMVAPSEVVQIDLEPDVVAFDASGNVILSQSLKNAAGLE